METGKYSSTAHGIRMRMFGILGLLCFAAPHALAIGQLKVQSELGQKLHAVLLLPSEALLDFPNECFQASLRQMDGRLLTGLSVERSGNSGLLLVSREEIKEASSRLVLHNACPQGSSGEYHLQLEASSSVPLPAGNEELSLSPTQARRRLEQRRTELHQASDTTAKAKRVAQASAQQPKILPLIVAHTPVPAPAATTAQHQHLLTMQAKLDALEKHLADLRQSPSSSWGITAQSGIGLLAVLLCLALVWLGVLLRRMHLLQRVLPKPSRADMSSDASRAGPKTKPLQEHSVFPSSLQQQVSQPKDWDTEWQQESNSLLTRQEQQELAGLAFTPSASMAVSPPTPADMLAQESAEVQLEEQDELSSIDQYQLINSTLLVEEMSDILQEAKFWVSIQRTENAIQLLEAEIHANRQAHAPSWMYLLDLYRQTHAREQYLALRTNFHRIFNGQVPDWDEADDQPSPRLTDLPRLSEKLAQILPTSEGISYLESLLLDDRQGTRQGFAYGIYRDLVQLLEKVQRGENWQNSFA